jgi:hypothetical protein
VAEHLAGAPRAQQVAVIDAIRTQRDRRNERHHLRARVRRAGPVAEPDGLID